MQHPRSGFAAARWYLVVCVAMTWPLVTRLQTQLPLDLGDPLLNCWILQWDAEHLLRAMRGDWGALGRLWHAGIFYPEPLALAYSEHLLPQAVQALPVYALTGNIVLCYNLLFLSTFILSGLGAFLLVRELTGSAGAGFLAGLFYAFAPYRLSQLGHLQVLSSQWMPFALYALRRSFDAPASWRPLAWAAGALVLQNLSCGYYLMYFPPFVAAYVLWEVGSRRLWGDARTWLRLGVTALAVAAATLPFLVPYLLLRQRGFAPRPMPELAAFSADPTTYLVATDGLWMWPHGFAPPLNTEAVLFPGFTPVILAVVALGCLAVGLWRRSLDAAPLRGWRLAAAVPVALTGLTALNLARFELFAGPLIWRVRDAVPFLANVTHVLAIVALSVAILLLLSPRARRGTRLALSSGRAFFASAFLAAAWLSFGPYVMTRRHGLSGPTLYAWLYQHVPGFDGLRVPARFGMLAMLFLAIVAGYGVAVLGKVGPDLQAGRQPDAGRVGPALRAGRPPDASERRPYLSEKSLSDRRPRLRNVLAVALAAFFLIEATGAPIDVVKLQWKRRDGQPGVVTLVDLERVYSFVRNLPAGTVVAEFPFGDLPQGEARAVFLASRHGHPIINGYSGGFPASYQARGFVLHDPLAFGERAWTALADSGATCLVVHEWAFESGSGPALSHWLEVHGAVPLARFQATRIYRMPR